MVKHFVELDHLGGTVTLTEVSSRRPENLKISTKNLVRFRYFDRKETNINGDTTYEQCRNFSCWYYVGKRLTLSEVKNKFPTEKELIYKMEMRQSDAVLICEKFVLPLNSDDRVFSPK